MKLISPAELFEDRNLATVTLIFMTVQFIFFEGMAVSIPKVAFMAIMPIIMLIKFPQPNKALLWGFLYIIVTMAFAQINGGVSRMSTFIYSALFIFTFSVYYGLVWIRECYTLRYFFNLIKWIILGYTIWLIAQQGFVLIGIRKFPLLNLMDGTYYAFNHLNVLNIEPSHAARLMTVFFYAFLKCGEYRTGRPMNIRELWADYKWVLLAFVYFMIMIGSGTAFVGLAIVALYFIKKQYALFIIAAAALFYMLSPYIDYEPYNRAVATLNATLTGDTEEVIMADHSASHRVNIILDTFTKTDLTDVKTWLGHGMDAQSEYSINMAIYEYGMISYIVKLLFFFTCCFTGLFSLETLMFIILFGMNIGNIAYGWAALMVFTSLKYFKTYGPDEDDEEDDEEDYEQDESEEAA